VWRENDSPDKAVRFNNLYTRLLTLPILSKKWAILDLLYQISESEKPPIEPLVSPQSPVGRKPVAQAVGEGDYERQRSSLQDASSARLNQQPRIDGDRAPSTKRTVEGDKSDQKRTNAPGSVNHEAAHESRTFGAELKIPPSETVLLRDLPFTLQGLSSSNLPFSSSSSLSLPPNLPLPIISLLHTLAEPSLLYRSLSDFVQSKEEGLAGQSLRAAIGIELRSYLGLIATLEGEIRRAITASSTSDGATTAPKHGVTLKRCVVWTREATMGLRLMSLMAEESKSTSAACVTEQANAL
jgi:gamma-tubulin complex component 3